MKKILVLALVCVLVFSLCGCDSSDYKKATKAYENGDYAMAREMFEDLGDYKDSKQKAKECLELEIDETLQGTWRVTESAYTLTYKFKDGRFEAEMSIAGASISNEGTYRIDVDKNEIYVCYDYIISSSGKTPNTEEQKMFTFTYDGRDLTLKNTSNQTVTKK